jgi:integrase/recombinase XerD
MSGNDERFDSLLGPTIHRYLTLKRALGREYRLEHDVLRDLDRFLLGDTRAENPKLTPQSFVNWTRTLLHLRSGVRRNRMRIVRNLCLYARRTDPDCFVPDPAQFPSRHQPLQPYIFTDADISYLIRATAALDPTPGSPLRPEVFRLATVLLYTTGLRRRELVRMTVGDYDPQEHTLLVRESKFHKSRLLPLSTDATRELETYLKVRRARGLRCELDDALLWNRQRGGNHYTGAGIAQGLRLLFNVAQIRTQTGQLPRVHDLRHAFAVNALLRWYRNGVDVQARLPALAMYMGHVSIASTQHYLQFVEELAGHASERFARQYAGLVTEFGGAR